LLEIPTLLSGASLLNPIRSPEPEAQASPGKIKNKYKKMKTTKNKRFISASI
jgi:hypothetical protein